MAMSTVGNTYEELKFQKCSGNLEKGRLSLFGFVLSIPEPPHNGQEMMKLIFKEKHFSTHTAVFFKVRAASFPCLLPPYCFSRSHPKTDHIQVWHSPSQEHGMNLLIWIPYIKLLSLKYFSVQLSKRTDKKLCSNTFT